MPNTFAYFMILIWPAIAFALFRALPRERALIWSLLGGYLILPPRVAFDFPLVPPIDKTFIASLSALVFCVAMLGLRLRVLPESRVGQVLMVLLLASPFASAMTNGDPILLPRNGLPGVGLHEGLSSTLGRFVELVPLLLGRQLLRSEAALEEILRALVFAGLVYSLPMLLEVRLSPQLNTWIYGFFQHDFVQMMRAGGFRPIVFLPHGLWVAFFAMMAVVASAALWRHAEGSRRTMLMGATMYLGIVLVLCKSMAALLYAMVLVPVVRFASLRWQLRLAAILACVTVLYPLLRGAELVPVNKIVVQAQSISAERADSLRFRLQNEEILLDHAAAKPFFGWGPWGRNHVYDPQTGDQLSTTDGLWVVVIGSTGWIGYIAHYGMLALPIVLLARASRRREASPHAGPLALILAFNLVDTLPNATLIAFSWLMCGALLGYAEALQRGEAPSAVPAAPRAPGSAAPQRPRTIL